MSNEEKAIDFAIPNAGVKNWKASGKKVVGTMCCHIPEEVIHAAGVLPVRVRATGCKDDSKAEVFMSPYSCSFARGCLQYLTDGTYSFLDGLVGSNGCQMAQRTYDNYKAIDKERAHFQFTSPRMNNEKSYKFFEDEAINLKENMEKLSGITVTDEMLKKSIDLYNETRKLIQELYDLRKSDAPVITGAETMSWILGAMSMPKEAFNEQLKKFLAEVKNRKPLEGYRARILLIGSALDDPSYVKLLEDQGGLIVTDVQCYGTRYLWEPVEIEGDNLTASLSKAYLSRPTCPRMCDVHTDLTKLIMDLAKEFKVDGVINVKMKNCDPWGGEEMYFVDTMKAANLPMLTLEREEITTNAGQVAVRTEAFIEMIEGGRN